jgi:hypothetical protein
MDPVLRLVAAERAHPFAHLGPLRTAPGPGEVLLEIPLRSRRLPLPPCRAAEVRALAFRSPAEQVAAVAAASIFPMLGDDWLVAPIDLAPHARTPVLWPALPQEGERAPKTPWMHVEGLPAAFAQTWRANAAALSAAQRLAPLTDLRDTLSSDTEPQTP